MLEELFVINPLVHSKLKKYIWFNKNAKREGLEAFWQLLVMEIYIDGFATDEIEYVGKKAFNKPVVDIRGLKVEEAIVFIEYGQEDKSYDICQMVTIINPAINKDRIVIFGTGNYGRKVYQQLKQRGIGEGIWCFIDSDAVKCNDGKNIEGIKIHNVDVLIDMESDVSVIEAAQAYKEMENILQLKGVKQKRFFYSEEQTKHVGLFDKNPYGENIQFNVEHLSAWCSTIYNKKLYYYGKRDSVAEKTGRCLQLMDFTFCGFLHDEASDIRFADDYIVEDILYDENFFILIDKQYSRKGRRRLNELGLKVGIDYNLINRYNYFTNMDNFMLDLNLGYTYKEGEKYSGFAIYGEENKDDYKIVCLGASTTDANINWEKCWPRFLYEKIKINNNVTVYNGGIAGYNSGQELIKLIRDVLPLKPDLIIVYDGLIDIVVPDTDRPFSFAYLENVFNCAKEHIDILDLDIDIDTGVKIDFGVKSGKTAFENWISNIEIMYSVAKLRGIEFLSFVQPSKYYMMDTTKKIGNWLLTDVSFWLDNARTVYTNFRKELLVKKTEENRDYIIDLTGLFDDMPEVYMDAVHLYAKGNEIVADNIKKIINNRGLLNC